MNKILSKIFLPLFISIFLIATAQAVENLKIGWVYAMANAPILIAKQKGYFKEQGLDVEIIKFNSGPLLRQAISAEELDLAYIGAPPVYHWYAEGLKSRILAKVNYGQAS
ncbi:MAG: ABC transporter substrate-binding protein, partial [Acidiferrobacterales bacterium]